MTSPSPHLDLDALADALAGEGAPAERIHLAGCEACAGRLAELRAADAAVGSQLGSLGTPALPHDLATRLDRALAAQQPPAPARPASVTALPSRRTGRSGGARWLPAAAAAALVLGGAGFAVSQAGPDRGSDAASTAAGGSAEMAAPAVPELLLTASGADWADPATPGTTLPQLLGGQAQAYRLSDEQARSSAESGEQSTEQSAEQSTDDAATSDSQDADQSGPAGAPAPPLPDDQQELARLRTADGLDACLAALLPAQQPATRPIAVDYATYDGEPALAVVLPDPDPAQASIFVVGADCSAADPDVLLFRRAPLP